MSLGHHRGRPGASPREAGVGMLSTSAGAAAFVALVLFAVQLTLHLYATSTVNAAGYDAARMVASRTVDHSDPAAVTEARERAEARFRELVGGAAHDATFVWSDDGDQVVLRVVVDGPRVLPDLFSRPGGLAEIDRTFRVRIEVER